MSQSNQLTIVIIAYHRDFVLLNRCLNSIDNYCKKDQIESIKIVLNDAPVYLDHAREIISQFPNLQIDLIPSYNLEPVITEYFNWNTQQLFKLLVSGIVTTEWYLIHDCKDYYVDNVDFFKECFVNGRAITKLDHTQYSDYNKHGGGFLPFNLAYEISCKVWNVDSDDTARWHLPTTTPFFVKTQMMKDMVLELRSMVRGFLPYLFNLAINEQRFATEFLMYSAYCMHRNGLQDYIDWSAKFDYFSKFEQSKDLRVNFPPNPQQHEKHFESGRIWQFSNGSWLPAVQHHPTFTVPVSK
jgi:hypothetical protein